jgi:myo-inositol-1(or 4)-monophosphatase
MRPLLNTAIKIARQTANQLVRSYDDLAKPVERELQQEMGQRIQTLLFQEMKDAITAHRPEHQVQLSGQPIDPAVETVWVVQPLIGEAQFMQHNPNFLVGIAAYQLGKPVITVLYDCLRNDLYTATTGEGATLNGRKMRVSDETKLEDVWLVSQIPVQTNEVSQSNWANLYQAFVPVVKQFDCDALTLLQFAQVASGHADAFAAVNVSLEAMQFGLLLLKEAGALVTDLKGSESDLDQGRLLAANPKLVRALLGELKK